MSQKRLQHRSYLLGDDDHGAVVGPLSPPLDHVHQLDEGIGRGGHLVVEWPAGDLKELRRLRLRLDAGHQLGERDHLLVDAEDPRLYLRVVGAGDVLHGEHRAVLRLLVLLQWPEDGIALEGFEGKESVSLSISSSTADYYCYYCTLSIGGSPRMITELHSWS